VASSALPPLPQFPLASEGEPAAAQRPISVPPIAMDVRVMSRPWLMARPLWMVALSFGVLSALTAAVVAVLVYGWRSGDGAELSLGDRSAQEKCEPKEQGSSDGRAGAAARPIAVEQLPLVHSSTALSANASTATSTQSEAAVVSADSLPVTPSESKRAAPTRAERRAAAAAARVRAREAAAARRLARKTPTTPVARSTAPPKRAVIAQALARAAGAAKSCGVGPQRGRVAVTFSTSGVVRAVQLEEAFDDRSVGSCVLRAMGRARVPEFAGEPLVVRKTVSW
ncbi:MAG TPA: hypothetical protein VER33_26055, partial [Polyangiaceae bacterium]|nr:hypothetical protein [Polyangiaceae bacterium]